MRLPAEWEPQRNVIFAFPRRDGDWGEQLDAASHAMISAANLINITTPTLLIVSDVDHFNNYKNHYLGEVIELPTDDCWVRDYGPITCAAAGGLLMKDFQFTGWGGKFAASRDNIVPPQLHAARFADLGYEKVALELEGGSIESDGHGTLLTTTTCLLNTNRNNGGLSREQMERRLETDLGAKRILWLENGYLLGDDTDAHVDTLARFVDAGTIAYVRCTDPGDAHYEPLLAMEAGLRAFRTARGRPYRLLPLPWCPPVYSTDDGHRLPATYANFLLSNGHLFVPTYYEAHPEGHPGREADGAAISLLSRETDYTVVPVPSRAFIEQHGSLHCLTMQIPGRP